MGNSTYLLFLCVAMHVLLVLVQATSVDNYETISKPTNTLSTRPRVIRRSVATPGFLTCGATLSTPSGDIVYKPYGNVTANERCVWLIIPPSSLRSITLKTHFGLSNGNEFGLRITAFSYNVTNSNTSIIQVDMKSVTKVTFHDVQVVMVTFHSGSTTRSPASGFLLEYHSSPSADGEEGASVSVVQVPNANSGYNLKRFPSPPGRNGKKTLTLIIFKPANNTHDPFRITNFAYGRNGVEGTRCNEGITLMAFNVGTTGQWSLQNTTCGSGNIAKYEGQDLVLLLLESGSSPEVDTGLSVSYCSLHNEDTLPTGVTCGGTLTSSTGRIEFNETVPANVRCAWIIKPSGAKSFTLKTGQFGFPIEADIGLHVTTFRHQYTPEQHLLGGNSTYTFNNVQMVMITFFTGSRVGGGSGFNLEYTSLTGQVSYYYASGSVIHLSDANRRSNKIRYPSWGNYGNYELTPIILKPANNIYSPRKPTNLAYIPSGLEGCEDRVKLFEFNRTSRTAAKWTLLKTFCQSDPSALYTGLDLAMILFESNGDRTNAGFHLMYGGSTD